jgi:hypothetical protein
MRLYQHTHNKPDSTWMTKDECIRFELVCEWPFVDKYIRVLEFFVESVLYLLHAGYHAVQVAVSREHDNGSVSLA